MPRVSGRTGQGFPIECRHQRRRVEATGQHEDRPATLRRRLHARRHVRLARMRAIALHDTVRCRRAHVRAVGADAGEEIAPAAMPDALLEEMVPKLVAVAASRPQAQLPHIARAVEHGFCDQRKRAIARYAAVILGKHHPMVRGEIDEADLRADRSPFPQCHELGRVHGEGIVACTGTVAVRLLREGDDGDRRLGVLVEEQRNERLEIDRALDQNAPRPHLADEGGDVMAARGAVMAHGHEVHAALSVEKLGRDEIRHGALQPTCCLAPASPGAACGRPRRTPSKRRSPPPAPWRCARHRP